MPGKALLSDDDLAFDFFLAQKLGMTVADMRERMSQREWLYWTRYYDIKAQAEELARMQAGG